MIDDLEPRYLFLFRNFNPKPEVWQVDKVHNNGQELELHFGGICDKVPLDEIDTYFRTGDLNYAI